MCLGGHSSQYLRQHMKEERNNSPTNNRQGGTAIDLLHISGSSGEGVSTVIIFIVTVLLLSLGAVALWFLWRCIRECNRGSGRGFGQGRRPGADRECFSGFSGLPGQNLSFFNNKSVFDPFIAKKLKIWQRESIFLSILV